MFSNKSVICLICITPFVVVVVTFLLLLSLHCYEHCVVINTSVSEARASILSSSQLPVCIVFFISLFGLFSLTFLPAESSLFIASLPPSPPSSETHLCLFSHLHTFLCAVISFSNICILRLCRSLALNLPGFYTFTPLIQICSP